MDRIPYDGSGELWIASIRDVQQDSTERFDRVISVCQDTCRDNVGCQYDHFSLADGEPTYEEYGGSYDYESFAEAMDHLYDALYRLETVCIHCHVGASRSVSVSTGVLGRMLDLAPYEALGLIKDHRHQANPDELLYEHATRYIDEHR